MAAPKTDDPIHLLGPEAVRAAVKAQAKAAEDDEDKKTDAAKAEDEDMEDDEDEKKSRKSKKAKSKKAEEEGGNDADASEDEEDKEKAAVLAERARCVTIFTSPSASANPALAAHLVNTGMSADAALTTLSLAGAPSAAAPKAPTLASRMAEIDVPNPGADAGASASDEPTSPKAIADRIIATAQAQGVMPKGSA